MSIEVSIPTNFTDAGLVLGMFEIRNTVEAVALCIPVFYLSFALLPASITAKIITAVTLSTVIGGFALMGLGDDSLISFIIKYIKFIKRRGTVTYNGSERE